MDGQAAAAARNAEDGLPRELSRRELIDRMGRMGAGALAAAMSTGLVGVLGHAHTAAAASPTAVATSPEVKRKFRYGMVIDTRRCVGCRACVVACKAENNTPPGVNYNVVVEDTRDNPDDRPLFLTKPCFHCENPPCTDVCPVSATFKREQDGIVVIDYDRCIGCRYCITACPYGARTFDFGESYPAGEDTAWASVPSPEYGQYRTRQHETSPIGNVRKCTFCLHLQDEEGRYDKAAGRWPACAKTCTGHAIFFGDFHDPNSEVSRLLRERQAIRLKEELGTEPNVYYLL
jgi:molybdopterin-containing oxidoreductase family iron-sulfur binding subunit